MPQQSIAITGESRRDSSAQNVDGSDEIRHLLHSQVQCVLATVGDGHPSQHLMAYAFEPNLSAVFVISNRHTEKAQNMLRNTSVSLLWDNRTGVTTDHCDGLALAARCSATPLEGWVRARAEHRLQVRNPELEGLFSHNEAAVFALRVHTYRLAMGYGQVTTWIPDAEPGQSVRH